MLETIFEILYIS